MAEKKEKGKKRKKRGRGSARVAAVLLAGAVCCWTGLVKVDRRIRAVTINQSPPLWEAREDGDLVFLTLMGHQAAFDLGPVKQASRAFGEEALRIIHTPAAPERMWRMVVSFSTGGSDR